jgi:FXSXX-COOH protein
MTPTANLTAPAPAAPLASALADLSRVTLAEMPSVNAAELSETLGRVLPSPDAKQVPVAAFNSSI